MRKVLKWVLLAALAVLVLLLAYRLDLFSVEFITGFSEISLGLTIFIIILLYALKGIIMVFPTPILYVAAGLAFPTWIGIIVTYAGLTVSLSIGHVIGERMGEEKVRKLLTKNKKVANLLNKDNENLLWLAFISRILPTPFGLVSLFFGALKVPYFKCMFMSLLGLSPFMIPTVFAGSAITNPFSAEFIVPFSISIGITALILLAYKSKLVTKNRITVLLIFAQIILIASFINRLTNVLPIITIAIYLFSILIVLGLVKKNQAAAYKVTWIIVIFALPISGALLYLLFGINYPAKRVAAHIKEHALIAKLLDNDDIPSYDSLGVDGKRAGIMQYIRRSSSYHPYKNTETTYYPMGELMFGAMLEELSKAKKFIFMEYFLISRSQMWDRTLEVLLLKAEEGVEVRLIFDDIGSLGLFNSAYVSRLNSKGIKVMRFNPLVPFISPFMNNRNHRKIMVIDGHTGFNGGINISDEYINLVEHWGVWKDTGVKLKGEAVWSFTLMFIETWNTFCKKPDDRIDDFEHYKGSFENIEELDLEEKRASLLVRNSGLVLPYGDSPLSEERLGENIYIDILEKAERYVYIFTPYLIISEKMIYALQMAAKKGVDVRIVTPGKPDKWIVHRLTRSYYSDLLNAGVKIYEFTPGFLHAKSFVCDDEIAVVGTINLDYRSLYLHFECATLLYKVNTIVDIKEDVLKTIAESSEILPMQKRRFHNELFDSILHLFAPLM